jgi:sialate O-acetylesterase
MMKKTFLILVSFLALLSCQKKPSGLELPALIGDNMILQQKTEIHIWGNALPGTPVDVSASWGGKGKSVTGDDKVWSVTIPSPEAGGPFTITVAAPDTTITLNNVLVGEVWVCSGQSNMEMPLAGWPPNDTIMYSAKTITSASVPEIRLFNVQRKVSAEPLKDCSGKWEVCSPSSVGQFSAAAYFFGKKLHDELNVPVGLIESAWGGTPAEAWMSADILEESGEFVSELKKIKESVPLIAGYQSWLNNHKQIVADASGESQWKNLTFSDDVVPDNNFNDSGWPVMKLPGQFEQVTGDFDGVIWFRRSVDLPEEMSGKELTLSLGPIDDMDRTYFNGQLVGSHEIAGFWQAERNYDIPKDLARQGKNMIAVRVLDNQGGGGIWGKPGSMKLMEKDNQSVHIDIEGEWKYQPAAELIGNRFFVFDPSRKDFSSIERPSSIGPSTPSSLFNGMINPLLNYPVKGAIWYQGESNVGRAEQYAKIFPLLIRNWREAWNNDDLSFYFVQIAPYVYSGVDSTESAFLREAQEKALQMPNTGMVVTLDIATVMNIHPPFKKEVGERLANLALSKNYSRDIATQGPVFKSATAEGKSIRVQFDNIGRGLVSKGAKLTEFELAGQDGNYMKADARIAGNEVVVSSPKVPKPVFVRYCWRNGSTASLFNGDGLPALQFRTK